MATYTVDEIQSRIASVIDQSATPPTDSSNEYAWRLKFINRAYQEWVSAYDWEALRRELFVTVSSASGQATLALPADYQKMAMPPILYGSNTVSQNGESWPEIVPEDRQLHTTEEKYFYILGSRENFNMIWNPGTLASGASLLISYFSFPTSLASPADVAVIPNPEFLAERTIAYILEARSDPRYQQSEGKAREILLQMVDNENNKGLSLYDPVKTTEEKYFNFRVGRD